MLAPFRKQNTCDNSRKVRKSGADLIDSMLNVRQDLDLENVSQKFTAHENIAIPSEEQIVVNDL